jgi:hypothetical protein
MKKGLTCFGFVSGNSLEKTQVSDLSREIEKQGLSSRDDQSYLYTEHKSILNLLISLVFSPFLLVKMKNAQMRLNALTAPLSIARCFGFVSGNFSTVFKKQKIHKFKSYGVGCFYALV